MKTKVISINSVQLPDPIMKKRIKNIAKAFNINLDNQEWYELYYSAKGEIV